MLVVSGSLPPDAPADFIGELARRARAGLVWAPSQDMGQGEALRYAAASGAATPLSEGTTLCRKTDVLKLAEEITPTRLG